MLPCRIMKLEDRMGLGSSRSRFSAGVQPAPVRMMQTGVSDGCADHATFTLYTEAAGAQMLRMGVDC